MDAEDEANHILYASIDLITTPGSRYASRSLEDVIAEILAHRAMLRHHLATEGETETVQ